MERKLLLILPLLAVVIVSGCTGTGGPAAGGGVAVLNWVPDFTSVNSGEKVQLQLRVQNQGDVTAKNVKAQVAGINMNEWRGFGLGLFAEENLGNLLPFDPESSTPGEIKQRTFSLTAPRQQQNIILDYKPIIKLSYDYETFSEKPITLVDQNELRTLIQQGNSLPAMPSTQTKGPLSVAITTGQFVKTGQQFGAQQVFDVFPVNIKITNPGFGSGGTVIPPGLGTSFGSFFAGQDMNYPVQIEITPPAGTQIRNTFTFGGDDCSTGTVTKDLFQGREIDITCELEVTNPPAFREDRSIKVNLKYRYQAEATTQVRVIGTKDSFGFG